MSSLYARKISSNHSENLLAEITGVDDNRSLFREELGVSIFEWLASIERSSLSYHTPRRRYGYDICLLASNTLLLTSLYAGKHPCFNTWNCEPLPVLYLRCQSHQLQDQPSFLLFSLSLPCQQKKSTLKAKPKT